MLPPLTGAHGIQHRGWYQWGRREAAALVPGAGSEADAATVRRTGTDDAPAAVLPLRSGAHSTGGCSDAAFREAKGGIPDADLAHRSDGRV
jgi:hypothetical protein